MYLAEIRIQNYRCFTADTIVCSPGVNVLIGENNAGKSTVIGALALLFGKGSHRLQFFDFHQPALDAMRAPAISITAMFRSSASDTIEDKALVAAWLTKLEAPWEAQVHYTFMLESEDALRANIDETLTAAIITEQGGKEKHRERSQDCSSLD